MKGKLLNLLQKRRSIRTYTDKPVAESDLEKILQAGLLAPSGRNKKPVNFIVVKDKETLEFLSNTRSHGSQLLAGANVGIVVIGDSVKSDTWIEDCSIAMTCMQIEATELGIGNCWVQVRGRMIDETGEVTADLIKDKLNVSENFDVECMLALGNTDEDWAKKELPNIDDERVFIFE